MEKTAGIVADDYKVKKFKQELEKEGFTNYETSKFREGITTIKVTTDSKNIPKLQKLCVRVESHFKALKN